MTGWDPVLRARLVLLLCARLVLCARLEGDEVTAGDDPFAFPRFLFRYNCPGEGTELSPDVLARYQSPQAQEQQEHLGASSK